MVEEWVVLGPHKYLLEKVYELIKKEGCLPLFRNLEVYSMSPLGARYCLKKTKR